MSKPWFLKMALEAEPSPLSHQIAAVLQKAPKAALTGVDELVDGLGEAHINKEVRPNL